MDLELLERTLVDRGEPPFRAKQVWEWASRGAASYEEMTNVPAALRTELARAVPFSTLEVESERLARDGTLKVLFRTHDGHPVEAVLMRYRDGRRSICVSSQSGCPLTCTFCATGSMAFGRNLTASEMLDQVLHFRRIEPVNHLVFMGMGEPLLNLDNVLGAARKLPDIGITHRRTTISTVGWLPALSRFVDEVEEPIRLAFSLHAPEGGLRSQLMPVNERFPLADVLAECRRYVETRGHKVFIEYVMLAGVNDRVEQAQQLAVLLQPRGAFKVNLIPYNPTGPVRQERRMRAARGRRSTRSRSFSTARGSRPRSDSRGAVRSRRHVVSSRPKLALDRIGWSSRALRSRHRHAGRLSAAVAYRSAERDSNPPDHELDDEIDGDDVPNVEKARVGRPVHDHQDDHGRRAEHDAPRSRDEQGQQQPDDERPEQVQADQDAVVHWLTILRPHRRARNDRRTAGAHRCKSTPHARPRHRGGMRAARGGARATARRTQLA